MKRYYNVHVIWLLMMLLTVSTYFIGALGYSGVTITLFLLATAVIKGGLIIGDFMELKGVALAWQLMMYGWLCVVCLAIAVAYLIGLTL